MEHVHPGPGVRRPCAVGQIHAHMVVELHGVGAAQQVVGDHRELRHLQRPQRWQEEGLGDRRPEQGRRHREDEVHREAADPAVDCVHPAHVGPNRLRHGGGDRLQSVLPARVSVRGPAPAHHASRCRESRTVGRIPDSTSARRRSWNVASVRLAFEKVSICSQYRSSRRPGSAHRAVSSPSASK